MKLFKSHIYPYGARPNTAVPLQVIRAGCIHLEVYAALDRTAFVLQRVSKAVSGFQCCFCLVLKMWMEDVPWVRIILGISAKLAGLIVIPHYIPGS